MADLDLDDFENAADERSIQWAQAGIDWQLHKGPTREKSAAWIDFTTRCRLATLIVWTTGEAELEIVVTATGEEWRSHRDVSDGADLAGILTELTDRLRETDQD